MTAFRSLLFNLCFFGWSLVAAVLFAPLFILSARAAQATGHPWAAASLKLARWICRIKCEIRGREHLVDGPVIYASKHQSAWDTLVFLVLLRRPAYILKRSLLLLPGWGWYLWRMRMIAIDRKAAASSMKKMLRQAKDRLEDGRPVIIYPEGTRTRPGAAPHYHPGVLALYRQLNVPVIPVALNSGVFWGKNAFTKHPGTIVMQILPAIAPGLGKEEFMSQLQSSIETASQKLLEEAKCHPERRP